MRTPGHAVLNLLLLTPAGHPAAVVAGALAPDVPIVVLYAWERYVRGTPEERVWSDAYQRPGWQAIVHGAHSIPIALAVALVATALGASAVAAFALSALLHALEDLPVHAEDAHRHFLPLSRWRFVSPISYWDVRHHGRVVAACEGVLVALAAAFLWRTLGVAGRVASAAVSLWYAHGYWKTFVRNGGAWQPYF